ncbi:hypothetical protein BPC006_I2245 [Burkholderia pseudomallei BPC006]|nr:hypothetical protein BPC006_I2245 [Burkholderia pseudomallei BPC006]
MFRERPVPRAVAPACGAGRRHCAHQALKGVT